MIGSPLSAVAVRERSRARRGCAASGVPSPGHARGVASPAEHQPLRRMLQRLGAHRSAQRSALAGAMRWSGVDGGSSRRRRHRPLRAQHGARRDRVACRKGEDEGLAEELLIRRQRRRPAPLVSAEARSGCARSSPGSGAAVMTAAAPSSDVSGWPPMREVSRRTFPCRRRHHPVKSWSCRRHRPHRRLRGCRRSMRAPPSMRMPGK